MTDERESGPTPILASDAERERSIALLREAVGEGRLTLEEFSERVGLAQAARTDQELARVARDLPGEPAASGPAVAAAETHRAFCSHLVRSGPWSLPPRSSWRSIFATIDLDLRQARLSGPDTALEVHNLFGTVTVLVPEGVEVVSWYVMMGIGQVVTLRLPASRLREVNRIFESTAWGAYHTEFYPTYDFKADALAKHDKAQ